MVCTYFLSFYFTIVMYKHKNEDKRQMIDIRSYRVKVNIICSLLFKCLVSGSFVL